MFCRIFRRVSHSLPLGICANFAECACNAVVKMGKTVVRGVIRWLDLPPVWLFTMLGLSFALDQLVPGMGFDWPLGKAIGGVFVVSGVLLMGAAVIPFALQKTSVIPRQKPKAFVRSGVYRMSRNPIYLGDALVLMGCILRWDVLPALLFVPLFIWVITTRFILGEEAGLKDIFGAEYENWAAQVRRWI